MATGGRTDCRLVEMDDHIQHVRVAHMLGQHQRDHLFGGVEVRVRDAVFVVVDATSFKLDLKEKKVGRAVRV